MKQRDVSRQVPLRYHQLREHVHDTYRLRSKLPEPARCPQCAAVYRKGRWVWSATPVEDADEVVCQACHRINDRYPAGEISLHGTFVAAHREEIVGLARNLEEQEKQEHPLHRLMGIEDRDGDLVITTTDIHLPHRIGHALVDAWDGELQMHYDEEGYFLRINWRRDL